MVLLPIPPATVTLDVRATSLTEAIPRIGAAFGVSMRAAPSIGGEIGIFSLHDADLLGFKSWAAQTLGAEWNVDRDGTLVLNRAPRLREAKLMALRERRLATIRGWRQSHTVESALTEPLDATVAKRLRGEIDAFLKRPPTDDATRTIYYRQWSRYLSRLPAGRMFARTIARLPDEAFTTERMPARIVYSSRPVGRQLPLPFDPTPILREYAAEANVWADATADLPPSTTVGAGRVPLVLGRRQEPVGAVPILVVSMNFDYGNGAPEVALYDESGRRVAREGGYVGDNEFGTGADRATTIAATKFPVTYSEASKAFAAAHFPPEGAPPNPAAVHPFLDVVRRDPLSYGASDGLFALARARRKNLISRGGDDLVWVFRAREDRDSSVAALNYFGFGLKEEGDWASVDAEDPDFAEGRSLSRPLLARMLGIADATGLRTIEDVAALAALLPDPSQEYDLAKVYGGVFSNWPNFDLSELAFYGRLTPAERRRAASEAGLPIAELGAAAREVLERSLLLRRELRFSPLTPADASLGDRVDRGTMGEPTILLADGFPVEARLHLRDETLQAVRFGEGRYQPVLTPEEAALATDRAANPSYYPNEDTDPLPTEGLVPVTQRRLTLEIRTSRLTADERILTSEVRTPGGPYTAATLPSALREAFARASAILAERNRNRAPVPETPKGTILPPL